MLEGILEETYVREFKTTWARAYDREPSLRLQIFLFARQRSFFVAYLLQTTERF